MTELERIVHAVLYEGYALYPYRPSSLKNQRRFAFGVVYPRAWAERTLEPAIARCEIVAIGDASATIAASVRFLRLVRGGGSREERVELAPHALGAGARTERAVVGELLLDIEVVATPVAPRLWRFAIEIRNETPTKLDLAHEDVMDLSPASALAVLTIDGGELVSAIEPGEAAAAAVAGCRSSGLYPVLVSPTAMLASPIILPDQPQIAPQSPGDFFDGTEIDEMLTLRVLTMTEAEKHEAKASDPRVAALIARTEALGLEETARLHGVVHTSWPREGTRVRVRPGKRRADAFDILLAGKLATVSKIERDLEGQIYCAVTVDDDPGADLGALGLPGHRFMFRPDELEIVA